MLAGYILVLRSSLVSPAPSYRPPVTSRVRSCTERSCRASPQLPLHRHTASGAAPRTTPYGGVSGTTVRSGNPSLLGHKCDAAHEPLLVDGRVDEVGRLAKGDTVKFCIDIASLGIYTAILLSLLSFSVEMTLSPSSKGARGAQAAKAGALPDLATSGIVI